MFSVTDGFQKIHEKTKSKFKQRPCCILFNQLYVGLLETCLMFSTYETETRYFSISLNKKGGDLMTEIDLFIFLDLLKKRVFLFLSLIKFVSRKILQCVSKTHVSFSNLQYIEFHSRVKSLNARHNSLHARWNIRIFIRNEIRHFSFLLLPTELIDV